MDAGGPHRRDLQNAPGSLVQIYATLPGANSATDKWLELEAGITSLFARHSTEWDADLLFKKPWTLSKKVEFMFGVGPEWVRIRQNGLTGNSVAGEAVLDFMFWPSVKRRFGWYLEPGEVCKLQIAPGGFKSVSLLFPSVYS